MMRKKKDLIKIPSIKTKMIFKYIDLVHFTDETYFEYADKCAKLYYKFKNSSSNKK